MGLLIRSGRLEVGKNISISPIYKALKYKNTNIFENLMGHYNFTTLNIA